MSLTAPAAPDEGIVYPDSDGRPMADNTKQARWITVLFGNLSALFRDVADVFVAMDLLWYAARGRPEVRTAPDVLVVFGRPKGDRGSYRQWEEGSVPLTVVFEVLSPGNTVPEMAEKFEFYEEYGVEEYYIYDPDHSRLQAFVRRGEVLARVRKANGFVSPRLGIRFDLSGPEMIVLSPNGRPFLTFEELEDERVRTEQRAKDAEQRASDVEQRIESITRRADRQAELMRKALRQQATADELQELQQLLGQQPPPA
jgi:Uma2 family endonuclease